MLSELQTADKVVGVKQTKKALAGGNVIKLFLARDADSSIIAPLAEEYGGSIPIEYADSMNELGKACEISVGCAAAALVR